MLIPNEQERKRNMRIRNGFEKLFCLRSNLSNGNIISRVKARSENGYEFYRSGVKTGVDNYILLSEIDSGFGEPGGTPLRRIPRSIPPPRIDSKNYPKIK